MKLITLNKVLILGSLLLIGFNIYRHKEYVKDYVVVNVLHLDEIERPSIEKAYLKEKEVFLVHVLSEKEKNCWYENNYEIIFSTNGAIVKTYAHLRTAQLSDKLPPAIDLQVPEAKEFTIPSAISTVKAKYRLDAETIFVSMYNLPVASSMLNMPKVELASLSSPLSSCCSEHKATQGNNSPHTCLELSPNCSAAPAFRGFIHFDWHEWFELKEFSLAPLADLIEDSSQVNTYRLKLALQNKKLSNFRVIFADIGREDFEDIQLLQLPENFKPYLSVHSSDFENILPGQSFVLEFDFRLVSPQKSPLITPRLLEIEVAQENLFFPAAQLISFDHVEHEKSALVKFSFDVSIPTVIDQHVH